MSLRLENGTHICSGSILDDLNVLTTANCVFEYVEYSEFLSIHIHYFWNVKLILFERIK